MKKILILFVFSLLYNSNSFTLIRYSTNPDACTEEGVCLVPISVYGTTEKTKAFQDKLKELKVEAVIVGNCGCGLCTTKETGSAIAAEYIGIPTVTIGAPTFIAQIHSTGVNRGVPVLRTAEYPGAFAADSTETLKKMQKTFFGHKSKMLSQRRLQKPKSTNTLQPVNDLMMKLYIMETMMKSKNT